jgi:hypothetical protein
MIFFSIFFTFIDISSSNFTNVACGDWKSYKDEKCIQVIDKNRFFSYDEAIQFCSQQGDGSTLLTIHSREELEFISQYLFGYHEITNDIWIGLRKANGIFKWVDDSYLDFTNWAAGNPSNQMDFDCVQMSPGYNQIGEWEDKFCNRKDLVVCQKIPTISMATLSKKLLETNKFLVETQNLLADTRQQLFETNSKFNIHFNNMLSNKWINYKLFTEMDGRQKAFFIPMSKSDPYERYTWDVANKTCAKFNATLVEVQNWQKQFFLETYLGGLGLESNNLVSFWLNGSKDLAGKWRWLSSGNEFTYTNWFENNPKKDNYDHLAMDFSEDYLGKWFNVANTPTFTYFAVCEMELYI